MIRLKGRVYLLLRDAWRRRNTAQAGGEAI
jgi:hypothetical protein